MRQILSIARKELDSFFGSPMALIFLGAFLAVTLFTFFWVEPFFARGLADVRPLFNWMPLLLIFLVAALTMRQWSEEQRAGTLEMLMTLPVKPWQVVIGKFLATMGLVTLALLLTLPLPLTVEWLGPLDWGPVIGGYLAALLMAAAYAAIGLFVSSRTDNQIVALISTGLLGGLIYLVGTNGVTDFVGNPWSSILRAIGTGSRFESIQRGVIDLRDLVYYLSIAAFFLALNTLSIESKRWSHGARTRGLRFNSQLAASLLGVNLLLLNTWLYPLQGLRVDLTEQQEYTLSQTTKDLLANLQEPLLIRGYISERSHPLLNPLRPSVDDLLREYEVAGDGKVTAEVVDPASDPEIEAEAAQNYNIQPVPFQVADRYQNAIINSYFDILVRYGDQNVVLSFRDLIEVEPQRDGTINVRLRNLEYDLTSAIKKTVYGFQSVESVLSAITDPVQFTLFVTPDLLPAELQEAPATIEKVGKEIADSSDGKFNFTVVNPDDPNSGVTRQQLLEQYGLQPFSVSLFSTDSYFLHMVLANGDNVQVLYPSSDLSEGAMRSAIENGLKRTTSGFLKTVGLWTPPTTPTQDMFGQMQQPLASWNNIQQHLSQEYTVQPVDLSTGQPPADIDTLFVVMPQNLTDKERFAIDQFLMRGGSVIVAAGNYKIDIDPMTQGLAAMPVENGLREMLLHYGIDVQQAMVLDEQNQPFPVPRVREVNGFQVQEIEAINFPFFIDVRQDGMARDEPIVAGLPAVTMGFASPVVLDPEKNANRETATIMNSTANSWLRTNTDIQPDLVQYPERGYAVEGEMKSYPLAVVAQGTFESFFKDKPSPFTADAAAPPDPNAQPTPTTGPQADITALTESPSTARLVVIGSGEFLDDFVLQLASQVVGEAVMNNLQFAQNAVDWSVEDTDLLSIRARGTYTRLLDPLTEEQQTTWEIGNYVVALLALLLVAGVWWLFRRNEQPMELDPPAGGLIDAPATGD
jgi:ABC-2 type transport system permease protein